MIVEAARGADHKEAGDRATKGADVAGRRFGPYELEELLGRGGMGEVHRAVDTRKSRTVALKLLPGTLTGDAEVEARFRREAELAARLNDPHVIPIHDFGELHGRLFLDMRFVNGVDLAKTLHAEGALRPARAVAILAQVASALDAAHDSGLVHRDVKPSNVLLTRARSDDFVYLIDFGIAAGSLAGTRLTATGQTVGTAAYMAPERFVEGRDSDPRVDVYALGCVLHEMLTGAVAFEGTSFPNLMYQHLNAPPPRPSRTAGLPEAFDAVVGKALAKKPDDRYRRAGDLADAARSALEPTTGTPHSTPAPAPGPQQPRGRTPTRVGPPPPFDPRMPSAPRFPAGPADGAPGPGGAGGKAAQGRRPWHVVFAIAAIVLNFFWMLANLGATSNSYSGCSTSTSACVGGTVGVVATILGLVGIVAGTLALRRRPRRFLTVSWIFFGVAFTLLIIVAAGLGGATSSS